MKISIIIPVYNGEQYILKCLDSIKKQTYSDIEIIVVNDGSTDNSEKILKKYVSDSSAMSIKIITKENAGLPQARKTGVENANGDYIGFLDVDDWVEPQEYKEMAEKAIQNAADVVCCGYQLDYGNKVQTVKQNIDTEKVYSGLEAFDYLHRRIAIYPYAWNKIYKKELLQNIKYPKGNFVGEDYAIQVQILPKAKRVCVVSGAGHHYVQVANSMCRGGYNENYILAFRHYEHARKLYCEKYPEFKENICNYLVTEYMAIIVAMGKNKVYNYDMARKIQKFVRRHLFAFLKAREVPIIMKGSAVAITINYKILNFVYGLVEK